MTVSETAGIHVLHVDDEPVFVELTADILEREDSRFSVEPATSAREGLDRLAADDFDCVVSDYQMPRKNGIEFLEAIRDEYPELPFILFTGKGSEEVASEAISAGATDYLQKGHSTDQYGLLANRIENAVEQYRAQRRAAELGRIRTLAREINQALVRANSRSVAETRVCEIISDSDPYLFAWIGDVDADTQRIESRASAGVEEEYLEQITVTADDTATGHGPGGTAIRERRVAVSQNIHTDPEFEPWRDDALERGYRSVAAVPLEHDDTLYGELVVYANRPHAFDENERELLADLGGDIGHAIHSKEREQELELFEQLIDNSNAEVYITDTDAGIIQRVNQTACENLQYAHQDLVGMTIPEISTKVNDVDEWTDVIGEIRKQDGEQFESGNIRADGTTYPVEVSSSYVAVDGDGYEVTIARDITERKEREQELRRQNERLEAFASVVAHDLRNPLNVAKARIELAKEQCDSKHLDTAAGNIERSFDLIDDMLTLTRQGQQVSEMEPIDIASFVESCWENVETAAATVVTDIDSPIHADPNRLRQLLENLMRNAIEHGNEDVTVRVGSLPDGFYVADDGPGIPEDERENVFEPGYSESHRGTGFGLAIVRRIAHAHDWEVQITESADGGARFEFANVGNLSE